MTADTPAGAASHNMDWQAIDWRKANQNVRRLQARIVKAIRRVLHRAFERLEPCEGRPSCTVLRGGGGSNTASLPGA
ncbi:MAG: reverse transcriptase N-terminal domain-containing protein, partial [Anaerolineales bacterium]|nr:reverse transcriptase N-terminal domain-containing protein [Anaerolineales bacterium]